MGLRLGYYFHVPAILVNGQIATPGYQGCFVSSLASYCDHVVCFFHSPGPRDEFTGDFKISSPNVELVDIGPHTSVPHRTIFAYRFVKPFVQWRADLDILLLRGPSPLLPAFARAAGKLPVALLLVSDYQAGINKLPQPFWRKELIRMWAGWNNQKQVRAVKRSLNFVNSHALYQQAIRHSPHVAEIRTSTLTESDFYNREDTCLAPPYHLLYAGRMDRTKGLMEIIDALKILTTKGYDCIVDFVGMKVPGDPILAEIDRQAGKTHLKDKFFYHGYKPLGPELMEIYRRSDIYVIASQVSEGFPRTIWEAMANSLPVVATRVGSIPDYIEGSAELVEPNNSQVLADAIQKLIDHPELRKHHIQSGMKLAREVTLEIQVSAMVQKMEKWVIKP